MSASWRAMWSTRSLSRSFTEMKTLPSVGLSLIHIYDGDRVVGGAEIGQGDQAGDAEFRAAPAPDVGRDFSDDDISINKFKLS